MLIDVETGQPYGMPTTFVVEKINALIEALAGVTSFEEWQKDLDLRADDASTVPLRCEVAYGHSLEEETVRCPNLAMQVVRVFKNSDDLARMCNDCASAGWSVGD
jgi:hypothetical protein